MCLLWAAAAVFSGCASDPARAGLAYRSGYTAYENKNYALAIEECTRAIEADPGYAEAYTMRGISHIWLDNPEAAKADFAEALRLKPGSQLYKEILAGASLPAPAFRLYLEGAEAVDAGDYDLGIAKYTEAIGIAPFSSAYNSRGAVYTTLKKKDYGRAEADFTEAVRLDPENYEAYANLGMIKRETGDLAAARRYAETALKLRPLPPT
ncbi:MAG: tetratricopeptide repeat protein [Treponema sp.]|nr:tetratricopeptide repeat protein [Treponema sp.]